MGYWIDEHKDDVYLWIEECEKSNNCDICSYAGICDNIEIDLESTD